MPPRKRTSQTSKHESPTSSSHVSSDARHHLHHTGSSIGSVSTRTGAGFIPSTGKPSPASPRSPASKDLPEKLPREQKPTAEVSPPGARVSFTKFMYALLFVLLLLLGWYIWEIVVVFERLKEEEEGWWGIIAGDSGRWEGSSGIKFGSERSGAELEGSLEVLASALGVSPVQVASAVKPLVPQASLASVASKMEDMGSSEAVRVLFEPEDTTRGRKTSAGILKDVPVGKGTGQTGEDIAEGDMD